MSTHGLGHADRRRRPGGAVGVRPQGSQALPVRAGARCRARHRQDVLGVALPRGGAGGAGRFLSGRLSGTYLVPQGGGDVAFGHRCPGEGVTPTMLDVAVRRLATACYTVAGQDLDDDLSRILTRPRSGVVLTAHASDA